MIWSGKILTSSCHKRNRNLTLQLFILTFITSLAPRVQKGLLELADRANEVCVNLPYSRGLTSFVLPVTSKSSLEILSSLELTA